VRIGVALVALTFPAAAAAHGFGSLYNLPVPFWLYAWGAGGALLLSFLVIGYFTRSSQAPRTPLSREFDAPPDAPLPVKAISVFLLGLCIATALVGNRDPYRNFSMTFFWIVFVLGFTYAAALFGNFWDRINPWRALAGWMSRPLVRYPERLGDWPALALYLGFIWFELFNHGKPVTLGIVLAAYTVLNIVGAWLVGADAWFRHCEFFSVMFRLISRLAPARRRLFARIVEERPERLSTVIFALALLSTTAFDGLKATQWWVGLFWSDHGIGSWWVDGRPIQAYAVLRPIYIRWETFWLIASPFLYFGLYLAAIALAKRLTRTQRPLRDLALDFGYTLLPIALVYNVTHYSTLILTQGLKIVSLASDPFGWGWNLFGTAGLLRAPILPKMGTVWHTQVALILLGHVVSVYCAHLVALRVFHTRPDALKSQWPMLALMIAFTVAGLWILAQPLTAQLMR
jgi:hypothetical protein